MKKKVVKGMIFASLALLMMGCGAETLDGAELGGAVCDCFTNANALPASDTNRAAEQEKCIELEAESWKNLQEQNDLTQESAYGDKFPCGM